ncbi:MAG: ERAP1-like C-terminal domain-containing protein [Sandaracinus sp.]|nr:ERAP1-like C-terminal domain-containing protein [Sandaracinus sp.]MCB9620806.1 ERAP1-like C-terminal domain-containing protein [Sandaracinus sp.]
MRQFDALVPNRRLLALASVLWLVGCGPRPEGQRPTTLAPAPEPTEEVTVAPLPDEAPPLGQLSDAVVPRRYRLALEVVPERHGFHGVVEIDVQLAEATRRVWLHGERLAVGSAVVRDSAGTEHAATYTEVHDDGVAQLVTETPIAAGDATIRVEYDAPFNRALRGLYRVDVGSSSYAFTQLEAVSARLVFPGFDEPRFKVPFELTMKVRADDAAIFNTPETGREPADEGMVNVRFAPTPPLPTYLLALAVGPLDVVEHEAIPANALRDRPIPLRGLAARGKGDQLAYALQNTARIVVALEEYFGVAYPYAKLDIAAVPDFAAGAMENPGLITFRETLLLLGDGSNAPEGQKRAYAYVMAHELAHQWFGNLVTMQWWDDLWLNEAFATWMGGKITGQLWPAYRSDLSQVEMTMSAMRTDSLVNARQIRQPIESNHDIRNAFDSITYRKGGAVLTMFERWMGEDVFRRGIQSYVRAHANGNATFEDLLSALSESAGRDVATSFRTFLFQPGLPFLETTVSCEGTPSVTVRQSRFLPVGSTGETDRSWQLPVCLRWAAGRGAPQTTCALIESAEQSIPLEACPSWVHPNADGAGYFRFGLEPERLRALRGAWAKLSEREQITLADSLQAAHDAGHLAASDYFASLEPLARSTVRPIAQAPMGALAFARDELLEPAQLASLQRFSSRLYGPQMRRLGWTPRRGEDGEQAILRAAVVSHLAFVARDAAVRREAERRALAFLKLDGDGSVDRDALDSNLVGTALAVAVQEGDAERFGKIRARLFVTDDALLRGQLLGALGMTTDPALAAQARELALDERVRVNELWSPLGAQISMPETRDATWQFLTERFDALAARLDQGAGSVPGFAGAMCSNEAADAAQAFFGERVATLPGGPRNLASAVERARLCAAKVEAHRESARQFFAR